MQELLNKKNNELENRYVKNQRVKKNHDKLTKWGLTAEQINNRKNEEHFKRFEKYEQEQRELEKQYEQELIEEKQKINNNAKLVKMHESERVKALNSAIQYSKVLKEREGQVEMKKMLQDYDE